MRTGAGLTSSALQPPRGALYLPCGSGAAASPPALLAARLSRPTATSSVFTANLSARLSRMSETESMRPFPSGNTLQRGGSGVCRAAQGVAGVR